MALLFRFSRPTRGYRTTVLRRLLIGLLLPWCALVGPSYAEDPAAPAQNPTAPGPEPVAKPSTEPAAPVQVQAIPVVDATPPTASAAEPTAPATITPSPEAAPTPVAITSVPPEAGVGVVDQTAPAQADRTPELAAGTSVLVDHFVFKYGLAHPDLPPLPTLEELKHPEVSPARKGKTLRAASTVGVQNVILSGIPEGGRFDSEALLGIAQQVVRWYNARGLNGVWVAYSDLETSATGVVDNRAAGDHSAEMVIWASQIAEVRTLARGQRIKSQFSINNRKHSSLIRHSPLHPPGVKSGAPGSLFSQSALNGYLYGLSLHPGRRVEASIASAGEPGKVVLDYLVNEPKVWQIFSQINNYGSEGTGVWRARVGYQDNQLTNHDDILNFDLISTPDFKTYGSFLSYRIPVFRPARLLARVYASYGDFLATDATLKDLHFAGKNWLGGIEFTNRLTLWRNWQLVSVLGTNFNHYGIQSLISNTPLITGYSNFLVPFLGTTLSRNSTWWSLSGGVKIDYVISGFANTDPTTGIAALGRIAADSEWTSVRWNLNGEVFLDRLFHRAAVDPVLSHQASLRIRGRTLVRGKRLIPHEEEPLGGALSVRGYPESIVAADTFITASFEYTYHLPRSLKPGEPSTLFRRPFKWRPVKAGQNPDWDLTLHGFVDSAYRGVTPAPTLGGAVATGEVSLIDRNLSMAGVGVGVGLVLKQNFSLRCDYGMALIELRDNTRTAGNEIVVPKNNSQLYVVTSFSW